MDTYKAYSYTTKAGAWTPTENLYDSVGTYRGIIVYRDNVARSEYLYRSSIGLRRSERRTRSHTAEVGTHDLYSTQPTPDSPSTLTSTKERARHDKVVPSAYNSVKPT